VLQTLTKYSFQRAGSNLNELGSLAQPEALELPALPLSPSPAALDKLQLGMPSARRVFALKVIEKYAGQLMEAKRKAMIEKALPPRRSSAASRAPPTKAPSPGKAFTTTSVRQSLSGGMRSVRGRLTPGRKSPVPGVML
jgi:hypothetical protein